MMRSRVLRRQGGQTLAEFAIILPVLLLILFAIVDLGRAVYAYSVVANCAREGARFGQISTHTSAGIIAAVKNAAVGLNTEDMTIGVSQPTADTIRVDVIYLFHPITPFIDAILHGNLALQSASTMYTGY